MRSENLKKHMKKHEGENEDNIMTKGLHYVGRYDMRMIRKQKIMLQLMKRK